MTRFKPPLDQISIRTLNYASWDDYFPKVVKTLMYRKFYGYICFFFVFFFFCINYFSFGVIKALDSKGILNTIKGYYVSHGMH